MKIKEKILLLFLTTCLWKFSMTKAKKCFHGGSSGCRYTCQCQNDVQCNVTTGKCPVGCAIESGFLWRGLACQSGNVALRKIATQSGTISYVANLAVDGEHAVRTLASRTCSEAEINGKDLWWRIDLGRTYVIEEVNIYEEKHNSDSVLGAEVYVTDGWHFGADDLCGTASSHTIASDIFTVSCPTKTKGRYVRIQQQYKDTLVMCEVSVIGYFYYECSSGDRYGPGCLLKCHCSSKCDHITGACERDCEDGYCKSSVDKQICDRRCSSGELNSSSSTIVVSESTKSISFEISNTLDEVHGYNIQYRIHKKDTEWKSKYISVSRRKRSTYSSVELSWDDVYMNTEYEFNLTSFYGNTVDDVGSQTFLHTTHCGKYGSDDYLNSCEHWCQCSKDRSKLCLLTCDSCSTCDNEPELPSNTDTQISFINIKKDEFTMMVNSTNEHFNDYKVVLGDGVRRMDLTKEQYYTFDHLSAGTTYLVHVDPLIKNKEEVILGFPLKNNVTTEKLTHQSTSLVLIISVSAACVILALITIIIIVCCIKRRRSRQSTKDYCDTPKRLPDEIPSTKDEVPYEEPYRRNERVSCTPVSVSQIQSFMETNDLKSEFEEISNNSDATTIVASLDGNKAKHRYTNIKAFDHSRVVLVGESKDVCGTYINASYIDGYGKDKEYIAMQAPKPKFINDLWKMVEQENINTIVMLTNLKENNKSKCPQYWPTLGQHKYGDVKVGVKSSSEFSFCVERHFTLKKSKDPPRHITHLQFTAWPDYGVPNTSCEILEFYSKVKRLESERTGPLLVHCTAGVGRSGTFIALDFLLKQAHAENMIDVQACVKSFRKDRVEMVQTHQQYR